MTAGLIAAPSICLTDLETVLDVLEFESERVHYLMRRREFEAHVKYEADEIDLLCFYLDNGFNIGETEFQTDLYINMTMKSKELDPYYVAKGEGLEIEKPSHAMTKWWHDILKTIMKRKPEKWVEASFILLCTTKEDQELFEHKVETLKKRIKQKRGVKKHNWIELLSGPPQRRFFIGGYPYETTDKKERNGIIHTILSSENAQASRGAVCIGINMLGYDYPYSVMALRKENNLWTSDMM